MTTQHFAVYLGTLPELGAPLADQVIMPKCDNETSVVLKESYRARNEHMTSLLEDYDHTTALHRVAVQMTHLAGVLNRVSDILSRERASAAFFSRVRIDFPHITSLQDVSHLLPDSMRSLAKFCSKPVTLRFGLRLGTMCNYSSEWATFEAYCTEHKPAVSPLLLESAWIQRVGGVVAGQMAEGVLIGFIGWLTAMRKIDPRTGQANRHYKASTICKYTRDVRLTMERKCGNKFGGGLIPTPVRLPDAITGV